MSFDTFHGWSAPANVTCGPHKWREMPLKTFDDDTVEMDITHCGVCALVLHTMDSEWGPTDYDVAVGHEITGVSNRVGKNVKHIKVGDRIGVDAQSGACLEYNVCRNGDENLCLNGVIPTYNSRWPNDEKTFGGYANKWRGHQRSVFKIPDNMSNEVTASLLCGGITTYSPLKRSNAEPGDKVGVVSIGGLGHFAVMWAKAMGAEVVALSISDRKREDAKALGCDDYVVVGDKEAMKRLPPSLTLFALPSAQTSTGTLTSR
ncbi:hypothetical protein VTP01DRAFT_5007 [Rhizomucor pusillus]|uniref:uncharacterized protein n=1 Tax=Rhizomucor pusillus TaxID=4840 RepID=UPI0037429EF9